MCANTAPLSSSALTLLYFVFAESHDSAAPSRHMLTSVSDLDGREEEERGVELFYSWK